MAIANSDGSIILSTKVDTSGINKGMSQMESKSAGLTKTFSKLGAALASAFAVQKIIQFSNESASLATQTEASVQRLIDIYGEASNTVGDFIDQNARALGMSKSAAASFSSVYGNLFSVWADQATNAELTNRYLNMTAVIASKTSRTIKDTQERIRSGLLGNTEAIEDLGIFVNVKTIEMTDAFQRMADGKSWEQLDAYTQQQIRAMAILEQATAKYGDEVADTSATIRNRYKAAYEDFQNSWGLIVNQVLLPVLETLMEIFNVATAGLNALSDRGEKILEDAQIQEEITDKTTENIEEQADAQKKLNKELKKNLAAFDDIQIISTSTNQSGEKGNLGDLFGVENTPQSSEQSSEQTSKIQENFIKKIKEIKKALEPLESSFETFFDSLSEGAEKAYNSVLIPFGDWIVDEFAPAFSTTLSKAIDSATEHFTTFEDVVSVFWTDTLSPFLEDLEKLITLLMEKTGEYFEYVGDKISENKEEIQAIVEFVSGAISIIGSYVMPYIERFFNIISEIKIYVVDLVFTIISNIGNAFEFIKNIILAIKELFQGNFEEAGEYFKIAVSNIGEAMLGIVNLFISAMNKIIYYAFETVKSVVNSIAGVVEKVGGFFGADWNLKWNLSAPQIPQIPKLAQGTVVPPNKEFMAVLGDNTKEHEIVSPLSTIEQAVENVLSRQGGTTREEHYYLNETQLMSVLYKLVKGGENLRGTSLEDGGY